MEMTDLHILKDMLARAEGPSLGVDTALMKLAYTFKGGNWIDPHTDRWVALAPYDFTSSIDAALALVERLLSGWHWALYDSNGAVPKLANCQIEPPECSHEPFDGQAPTPALAILRALVDALIAKQEAGHD